jgi:hypothetical protein
LRSAPPPPQPPSRRGLAPSPCPCRSRKPAPRDRRCCAFPLRSGRDTPIPRLRLLVFIRQNQGQCGDRNEAPLEHARDDEGRERCRTAAPPLTTANPRIIGVSFESRIKTGSTRHRHGRRQLLNTPWRDCLRGADGVGGRRFSSPPWPAVSRPRQTRATRVSAATTAPAAICSVGTVITVSTAPLDLIARTPGPATTSVPSVARAGYPPVTQQSCAQRVPSLALALRRARRAPSASTAAEPLRPALTAPLGHTQTRQAPPLAQAAR